MPETIQSRITSTMGFNPTDNGVTLATLNQIAVTATRWVMDAIVSLVPNDFLHFSKTTTVSDGNGTTVIGELVVRVSRDRYDIVDEGPPPTYVFVANAKAHVHPHSDISRLTDASSLDYATVNFPVAYVASGKLYILPAPDATSTGKVTTVQYPTTIAVNTATSITGVPDQHLNLVVMKTCVDVLSYMIGIADTALASAVANDDTERVSLFTNKINTLSARRNDLEKGIAELIKIRGGR